MNSLLEQMRPKKDYESVIRAREEDGKKFYQLFSNDFVKTMCPVCAIEGTHVFEKFGFHHRKCEQCKTVFCSPRPTEKLLSIYYNEFEAPKKWTQLLLSADRERKTIQYEPRANKIVELIRSFGGNEKGIAVDIGAGSGAFASALKRSTFFDNVIAMDFSKDCVSTCKQHGLDARLGSINLLEDSSVDLITTNDLIEHLFDPSSFLTEAHRVLKKNGFLSIATPNGEGFNFKLLKTQTENITPPEHLNYFNPASLDLLLTRNNFNVPYLQTPGVLDVSIVKKAVKDGFDLDKNNDYLGYLLSRDEGLLASFQKFLSMNRLSSHMLAIAQKGVHPS